jgi:hypothetical protein
MSFYTRNPVAATQVPNFEKEQGWFYEPYVWATLTLGQPHGRRKDPRATDMPYTCFDVEGIQRILIGGSKKPGIGVNLHAVTMHNLTLYGRRLSGLFRSTNE